MSEAHEVPEDRTKYDLVSLEAMLEMTGESGPVQLQAGIDKGWYPAHFRLQFEGVDPRTWRKKYSRWWQRGQVLAALAKLKSPFQ